MATIVDVVVLKLIFVGCLDLTLVVPIVLIEVSVLFVMVGGTS